MSREEGKTYAFRILNKLQPWIKKSQIVGSIRRKNPVIGDIDIVIEVNARDVPEIKKVCQSFSRIHSGGDRKLRLGDCFGNPGVEVDLWLSYPPRNFYTLVAFFTGVGHSQLLREKLLAKGYSRPHSEIQVNSEAELFRLAGVPFLPPEQRV